MKIDNFFAELKRRNVYNNIGVKKVPNGRLSQAKSAFFLSSCSRRQ